MGLVFISSNKNLPWEIFEAHPEGFNGQPWDSEDLSSNHNLSWEFVEAHPGGFNGQPWNMKRLTIFEVQSYH